MYYLGPFLFLIDINDLPDGVESCIKLFADDTKLYNRVDTKDVERQISTNLQKIISRSDIPVNLLKLIMIKILRLQASGLPKKPQASSPHTHVWQAYHLKQSKMVVFACIQLKIQIKYPWFIPSFIHPWISINIIICSIELKWDGKKTKMWYNNKMRWIWITVWNGGDL